jgi:hypothetical protein
MYRLGEACVPDVSGMLTFSAAQDSIFSTSGLESIRADDNGDKSVSGETAGCTGDPWPLPAPPAAPSRPLTLQNEYSESSESSGMETLGRAFGLASRSRAGQ